MKAFYQTAYGGREVEKYGDMPDPVVTDGKVLIEVKAVSINPVDYKIRSGALKLITGSGFPKVLGSDFAGTVKEVAPGVVNFKAGNRVYGSLSAISRKQGVLSELIVADSEKLRHVPEGMTLDEAASLPIAALTALNGLRKCGVTSGSNILINGATGGVGHFAVQIAKAKGACITATCSEANSELAKRLGADEIIGYRKEDLMKSGKKFDAILDAYGKMDYADVCRLLKRKGVYASTLFMPWSVFSAFLVKLVFGKKLTSSNMRSGKEEYEELERLFNEKKLIPVIENRFPIEKGSDAFEFAEKARLRGKVIITI
jgi:NADPH:quinone reductase-like Zn-dependent oxidoreductase